MTPSLPPTATTGAAYGLALSGFSPSLETVPLVGFSDKNPYGFNRKARRAMKAEMRRDERRNARAERRDAAVYPMTFEERARQERAVRYASR